ARQNSEEKAQPSGVLVQAVWKTDETPNTLIGISLSQFFKTHPLFGKHVYLDILCSKYKYDRGRHNTTHIDARPKRGQKKKKEEEGSEQEQPEEEPEREEEMKELPAQIDGIGPVLNTALFYETHKKGIRHVILSMVYADVYAHRL